MAHGVRYERGDPVDLRGDVREDQRQRFQERIAQGRYDDLYERPVRELLREGAAIRDLDEELGAIRFTLAKLLAEELDAVRLAAGVARLASVAVQVMRCAQSLSADEQEPFAELLDRLLAEAGQPPAEAIAPGW